MAKAKLKDVKKEVAKEDEEYYGEETMEGSSPSPESDDDAAEALSEMVGGEIKAGQEFELAEEVEKDEKARRRKPQYLDENKR